MCWRDLIGMWWGRVIDLRLRRRKPKDRPNTTDIRITVLMDLDGFLSTPTPSVQVHCLKRPPFAHHPPHWFHKYKS